jgi:hypothetical protein
MGGIYEKDANIKKTGLCTSLDCVGLGPGGGGSRTRIHEIVSFEITAAI